MEDKEIKFIIYFDGASKGNPGRAGAGVWIKNEEGEEIVRISRYLGKKTNNQAEYLALLLGLREAKKRGSNSVHIFTDSELIEKQIKGVYRVNDLGLKELYQKVIKSLKEFSSFRIEFIPREENKEADFLANQAIRKRILREGRKGETQKGTDGRSS